MNYVFGFISGTENRANAFSSKKEKEIDVIVGAVHGMLKNKKDETIFGSLRLIDKQVCTK